ncbi:MAG: DUF4492 domain-containing protein [Prevotella sp.]|nr:DUF4492 domain-containing protein [Prevotella sp.]
MNRIASFFHRAYHLYYDGFRNMTVGRTLWAVIIVKLIIIFAILKLFFFPNFIGQHAEKGEEAEFVAGEVLERSVQDEKVNGNVP